MDSDESECSRKTITVSIVSHGQSDLVNKLLLDIARNTVVQKIILTKNKNDKEFQIPPTLRSITQQITNVIPQGFGTNHNHAFTFCDTNFFAVLNPDIRLLRDPFPSLVSAFDGESIALVAPAVETSQKLRERNTRKFPTFLSWGLRLIGYEEDRYAHLSNGVHEVDWVAGMFMLFTRKSFKQIGGFDETFFLYYEDVDICLRLHRAGKKVILANETTVCHDAQRLSHKSVKYLIIHLGSVIRYIIKHKLKIKIN